MEKKLFFTSMMISVSSLAFSQVGINTAMPTSTLDVTAKNATGTTSNVDGLLIPRVTRERAQSMANVPISTLVYINDISTGDQTGNTANVDTVGHYFYNGTVWMKLNTSAGAPLSTNIYNSDGILNSNRLVTQNANTLAFIGTATNAFSVDGSTLSVDAANNRIGIGTSVPLGILDVTADNMGNSAQNDVYINGFGTSKGPAIYLSSAGGTLAAPTNLTNGDRIGGFHFNPRISSGWTYNNSSGITSDYKGNGTTNFTNLIFNTSGAGRVTIDENGNTGIATLTPGTVLDVNGAITNRETSVAVTSNAATIPANVSQVQLTGAATAGITITAPAAPNAGQRLVVFNNTTNGFGATLNSITIPNGKALEFVYSNSAWRSTDGGATAIATAAAGTQYFDWLKTGNAQPTAAGDNSVDIFHAGGRVAIGTTNTSLAGFRMVSDNDDVTNEFHLDDFNNTGSAFNAIRMHRGRGTAATPANLANGDFLGSLGFYPRFGGNASTYNNGSGVTTVYQGDGTNNLVSLRFYTSGDMPTSGERMRIDENGRIEIGLTTPITTFEPAQVSVQTASGEGLHIRSSSSDLNGLLYLEKAGAAAGIDQFVFFKNSAGNVGSINSDGASGVVYNTTSDIRLKENIRDTHYGIGDVMKIQVSDYNYKANKNIPQTGFIAQQLYSILPNAVTKGGEDISKPWMVDYSKVTPLLTKAIQDQQQEIEILRTEIAALKILIQEVKQK